jgi:hypothetical protein
MQFIYQETEKKFEKIEIDEKQDEIMKVED